MTPTRMLGGVGPALVSTRAAARGGASATGARIAAFFLARGGNAAGPPQTSFVPANIICFFLEELLGPMGPTQTSFVSANTICFFLEELLGPMFPTHTSTFAQGHATAKALVKRGQFHVRGVTSDDPDSPAARRLAALGVEVVHARPAECVVAFETACRFPRCPPRL